MSRGALVRTLVPRRSGAWLDRLARTLDPYATRSWSQEGEDLLLARLIGAVAPGFYVDVGAHHPRRYSNTCLFFQRGWHGINIDPNPDTIELFESERPGDRNLLVGVSDEPGALRFHRFSDPALNTFDSELAAERALLPGYRLLDTIDVAVERLDRLLAAHLPTGQTIDFLSVDAEGFDLRVLRSNDWGRFRPRWVLAEALGTTVETVLSKDIHCFMRDSGYELVAKTLNTLFYRDLGYGSS